MEIKCKRPSISARSEERLHEDGVEGATTLSDAIDAKPDSLVDVHTGCVKVKLATLKDERAHRNWHKLGNTSGEQDEHERGEVELCLRWCHDKARAYDLPKEFKTSEKAGTKAMPNELHVYLVRARDLEAMDSGLLGKASSDPIVVLDVMGTSHKSKQMKKELNPVWLESFSWPVEDDEAMLEVVVEDYDLTGNDFMGRTSRIAASRGAFTPSRRLVSISLP